MAWEVEFTDEFGAWFESLSAKEQVSIAHGVELLEQFGPNLKRPYADTVGGSAFANMRELRCQHEGRPYRVLYIFDPRRVALLLVGGDKTGDPHWYLEHVRIAEELYRTHLKHLKREE